MEFLIGLFIAFLIGITGVGAGILTTPLLMILLGLEPAVAVGTALIFATAVKGYAGLLYLLKGLSERDVLLYLCLGGIPGVLIGSVALSEVGMDRNTLTLILGVLVLTTSLINLYFHARGLRPLRMGRKNMRYLLPLLSLLIGLEVGFSSVGSGVLVELLLLSTTDMSVSRVVGTSLLFGFLLSLIGGAVHLSLGNADLRALTGLALGGLAGVFLALKVLKFLPQRELRYALLLLLLFIGGFLVKEGIEG